MPITPGILVKQKQIWAKNMNFSTTNNSWILGPMAFTKWVKNVDPRILLFKKNLKKFFIQIKSHARNSISMCNCLTRECKALSLNFDLWSSSDKIERKMSKSVRLIEYKQLMATQKWNSSTTKQLDSIVAGKKLNKLYYSYSSTRISWRLVANM